MLIPIFFTFNEAYALPAAVAIDSLLRHAAPHHDYRLHVLHSGLSRGAEASLQRVVARYANAQLA
ncbi:MAG: glycosyltransferase family 8 protein, partial [Bacteroidaceae bacterium]|nr:glycosyltransferase family 8 protein [Bacteroidaceae bacterium]